MNNYRIPLQHARMKHSHAVSPLLNPPSCVASSVALFPIDGGRIARNLFTFGETCKAYAVSYYGVSDCQTATTVSLDRCQQSTSGCAPTACHDGSGTI